ncbi:hypothetical protein ES703_62965 [subsurface metagenome]
MQIVPKVWGRELIMANNDKYAGKILVIEKGGISSLHRHLVKDEAFYCLAGRVKLELDGKVFELSPGGEPVRIYPGQWHRFEGLEKSEVMEVSTPHYDSDVERRTKSELRTQLSPLPKGKTKRVALA